MISPLKTPVKESVDLEQLTQQGIDCTARFDSNGDIVIRVGRGHPKYLEIAKLVASRLLLNEAAQPLLEAGFTGRSGKELAKAILDMHGKPWPK